ncbi:ScbA/BarX family gamma-butyrolactone biosynthesis protein [Streptomyces nanhaiensis]|uniref:ScbA/BarX family gamma-butyrolactone biosynthesis protein n=1 Tax=Streptomyces nanhaiensis TaxID=679319 RepID=UPI00399CA69D
MSIDALPVSPGLPELCSPAELGEYTHLRHSATILIKDWRAAGRDTFVLGVRRPAGRGTGGYDPRLLAQVIRQCGLFVAHAAYGVPTGHHTLLHTLNITMESGLRADEGGEFEAVVTVTRAPGSATRLTMAFRVRRDGADICLADTEFGWISPAAYRRVRGQHTPADWGRWHLPVPVAPRLVGRVSPDDVLLADGGGGCRWRLRNDVSNPLLFDHPVDHVPGLVLLEAAQQAAHAAVHPESVELTDVAIRYTRYVEFGEPCWIEAEVRPAVPAGRFTIGVTGHQGGRAVFRARLTGLRA